MLVLDTDVLTIIQRTRGEPYDQLIARLRAEGDPPTLTTIVTFEEQMRGWLAFVAQAGGRLDRLVEAYTRLRLFLDDLKTRGILDFDDRAAAEYRRLAALKLRLGTMDLRIAAIVLANGATLVTRNLAHFRRVPGLVAEDWTAPRDI